MFRKSEIALGLLLLTAGVAALPVRAEQSATEVLIQRARTLDGQGRHDLAAAAWQQVLLLNPDQTDALAALATFYQSNGDTTLANHYLALLRNNERRETEKKRHDDAEPHGTPRHRRAVQRLDLERQP